jgi:prefoldin beta subunit
MALPPAAQQLLLQLQTFQQQYQNVSIQRETLAIQKMEVDKALEELEKVADKDEIFKAVGPLLIKSTKADLVREMGEKDESIDVRLKSADAQEKKLREKMDEIQHRLQSMLGGPRPEGHAEPGEAEGESAG